MLAVLKSQFSALLLDFRSVNFSGIFSILLEVVDL